MFCHRPEATADRRLLKRVGSDRLGWYLSAYHHDWCGIRHAIPNRGHRVGCTRPGRNHHHPDLSTGARITRGHESGSLLVRRNDQGHWLTAVLVDVLRVIAENRIVRGQDSPSAVTKYHVHTLICQDLNDHLRANHFLTGQGVAYRG